MSRNNILRAFNDFSGSKTWAAKRLNVSKTAIGQWVAAIRRGETVPTYREDRLRQLAVLADQIIGTNGACLTDIYGENARSAVTKERRKIRKKRRPK